MKRSVLFVSLAAIALAAFALPGQSAKILIAQLGNGAVVEFDTETKQIKPFASGFKSPYGIAEHPVTKEVYVANFGDGTISKLSPTGGEKTTFASGFDRPTGLTFAANGDLLVICHSDGGLGKGSVVRVSPNGQKSTFAIGLTAPIEMAFSAADPVSLSSTLGVTSYGGGSKTVLAASVYGVSPTGSLSALVPYGATNFLCHGIFASGSDFYISVFGSGRILHKVGSDAPVVFAQSPLLSSAAGIALSDGAIYAVIQNKGTVQKITTVLKPDPATGIPTPTAVIEQVGAGLSYPGAVAIRN